MSITQFCIAVGAAAALGGMGLGIAMGMSEDFTLGPVHAHLNLLGWVTMALYGLYYRERSRPAGRLEWLQVCMAAISFPTMATGLALMLSGTVSDVARVATIAGSLLALCAMALFLVLVLRDTLAGRRRFAPAMAPDFDTNSG